MKIKGKPKDFARKAVQEFNDTVYHSPQDELKPEWDFAGFPVLARFTLDVARDVANADRLPTWNPGDEFRSAPLWGVGQRIFFLHDGRTSDLLQAIQAHASPGSEANGSVAAFNSNSLTVSDRQDILNFLRSL